MEDRCICCGEIIPEGRQVCKKCEHDASDEKARETKGRTSVVNEGLNEKILHKQRWQLLQL